MITSDSLKWLLDHAASAYETELQDTDKLKERINFILSLIIIPITGISVYLASGFKGDYFSAINVLLFWLPWFVAVIFLLISLGLVSFVLLKGFKYARPPLPSEIIQYFELHPEPDKALGEAHLALLKEYAASVDQNYEQNQNRSNKLLKAQRIAFLSIVFLMLCLPIWVHNVLQFTPESQPNRIESEGKSMTTSSTQAPSSAQQQQTLSPPPNTTPAASANQPVVAQLVRPPFPTRKIICDSVVEPMSSHAKILNENNQR